MQVLTLETPSLGDRSYVVTDGTVAAVVDPQRDLDRLRALLDAHDLTVTHVLETHVHNDYVTGGPELAAATGATYHVSADDGIAVPRVPVRDGDLIEVGGFAIRAVHTPGHTPSHLAYVVVEDGRDVAVLTGGSMLFGSVGRTDLVSSALTERLTRDQHRSVRALAASLPAEAAVLPTHGFGSFCSSGEVVGGDSSTIARQRRENEAVLIDDEDEFVRTLLAGLDAFPAYYAHMAPTNRRGPSPVDLSPVAPVDPAELHRRIHAGEWVVDLRSRTAFAADHVRGTVNVELDDSASTHLGWLLPWGTPVTLLADTPDEVAEMQRQLVRIGIDRPSGRAVGAVEATPDRDRDAYEVADLAALRAATRDGGRPWVLDTRRRLEWDRGHLAGAHHVPLHDLLHRLDEVPTDVPVWVHCASGYRASIAASLLARSGRRPVLVDDDFDANAHDLFEVVTA